MGAAVAQCNNPKFGDYQCNNAMALFGKLKGKQGAPKNPRGVAESILANVPENDIISELRYESSRRECVACHLLCVLVFINDEHV